MQQTTSGLFTQPYYQSLPLLQNYLPMVKRNLDSVQRIMTSVSATHADVYVVIIELRYPSYWPLEQRLQDNYSKRFIAAFKERLKAYRQRQIQQKGDYKSLLLAFLKATEIGNTYNHSNTLHHHIALFMNGDAFQRLGHFDNNQPGLASMIQQAWHSALNPLKQLPITATEGLVHFCAEHHLHRNYPNYIDEYAALFKHLSYFCKLETKQYQYGYKAFSCSRC